MDGGSALVTFVVVITALVVYLLPWIIAVYRDHHQQGAIFVINVFLGWTFLGWVIALAMAASAVKRDVVAVSEVNHRRGAELPTGPLS